MIDINTIREIAIKYKMHGQLQKAILEYKKILHTDPSDVDTVYNLGELYYMQGDMDESIWFYEKAVEMEPKYSLALYRLAIACFRATKFSKAIEYFDRIIKDAPDLYMAYYWKGLCYYHRGNTKMAIKSFKSLHKVNTKTTLGFYQMSISYKTAGRFKEAVQCLKKIVEEDPGVVSAQYHLGLGYLGLKKINKAMKCFEKVIELNPEHKGAQDKMDSLLTDQEMLYGYGISSQNEDNTKEDIITNFHVGQTYKGMSMIEEAFKHFKEGMKKNRIKRRCSMKIFIMILIFMVSLTLFAGDFESFSEFQTHIRNESQRVVDTELHRQIKQSRETREYEIGDTHIYWRYDLSVMPPGWIQLPATCRAVGEHCYVFVADEEWQVNMDEADVQEVFNYLEFETMNGDDYGVVEMDTLHFGEMPDELDNDPKLIVFYSALGSYGGSTFDGYFSSYDQVTEAEAQLMNPPGHSNECEMIYMTCHPLNPTDPIRISVLAHELEHLIHWGGDINEETWVDEGLAELAMVYFGMPDPISQFNSNPDNSLNTWNQEWADYVKTMLFFTYFAEQYDDGTIIKDLVSEPLNSIAGISNQLIEHGYTITFETIFENWTVANYLDDPDVEDGLYNYVNLELPQFNPTHHHISYPASGSGTTNPWATDYVRLLPFDEELYLHLEVDHPVSLGVIRKSDDVVSTVDFYIVNDVLNLYLPEMPDEYDQMILVLPNSDNSILSYNYEITLYVSAHNYELEISNYELYNYPNPFNPSTTISFSLTTESTENTELSIYNSKGQKVKTFSALCHPERSRGTENGTYSITWNGTNENNQPVSSGIYYYKLVVDNKVIDTKKMLLMK